MLLLIITTLIFCSLQQGMGNGINDISVCVDTDSDFLLVELQPPFPTNADLLDVDCSSMNDSFRKSCTVQLSSKLNDTISVTVSVHGSGVQMGYIYVVQATIHTSAGNSFESDLIAVEANYVKDVFWQFNNNTSITFHCILSNFCNVIIGGCKVSLIGHTDGKTFNQATTVVRGGSVVEVTFDELNTSDTYTFTAYAISQDLVTPMGRPVGGVILRPAMPSTRSSYYIISPTPSAAVLTMLDNPVTSTWISTSTRSRVILPTESPLVAGGTDKGTTDSPTSSGGKNIHSSPKGFPVGIIIGIVVVLILGALGVFSVIMISVNRLWPDGWCAHPTDESGDYKQKPLCWGSFDPTTDRRVHPSIKVLDEVSNEAAIDINDIQIVVNEAFNDNDHDSV